MGNPSFSDRCQGRSENAKHTVETIKLQLRIFRNSEKFRILYDLTAFGFLFSLFRHRFRYNSLRYAGRDYSLPGKYFVTICTAQRTEWFGRILYGEMHLSEIGHIASQVWYEIPAHFPFISLDAFIVMPDHVHGIIVINRSNGPLIEEALHATPLPPNDTAVLLNGTIPTISPKSGSLSVVVRSYKSAVTKHAHKSDSNFSWQRGFYDSIICTSGQLKRIRKYVLDNPKNWNRNE